MSSSMNLFSSQNSTSLKYPPRIAYSGNPAFAGGDRKDFLIAQDSARVDVHLVERRCDWVVLKSNLTIGWNEFSAARSNLEFGTPRVIGKNNKSAGRDERVVALIVSGGSN